MLALRRIAMAVALPVVILVTWWFVSSSSTSIFWPPLSEIVAVFPATWFDGRIVQDVLPSIARLLVGFTIAVLIGVVAGIVIGLNRVLRDYCEPVLEFVRAIPPPVLIPVIMLFA
ncbi:MAG: ABC transporter permease, partial [Microbacterium sp.]|uniref:ABC transporter permease n=1 Tax=Microbacterium sp. TaxID=51671 RepID=UPI0027220BE5|nr:ABC transporter permease [Microbacterium sp.]